VSAVRAKNPGAVTKRVLDSVGLFSLLLAAPGAVLTYRYAAGSTFYGEYLHATGDLAARLLIAALAVTPLRLAFPRASWTAWLARRRRQIGVAVFGYALLHAAAYLLRQPAATVAADAMDAGMAAGWDAFVVLAALAATSNDASVRRLRRGWKLLHRAVYAAAILAFAHWIMTAFDPVPGGLHLGVLAALEGLRVGLSYASRRHAAAR
jgi:sulfoxide reductase heme-binding subunit YedZ